MQNHRSNFKIEFEKRLVKFSLETIALCREIRKEPLFWPIADQLLRSATSIGANVIEARAASSQKDFQHFFCYCIKERE